MSGTSSDGSSATGGFEQTTGRTRRVTMNINDFSRQLGSKLQTARLNRGLTLAQVEERSGGRWTKHSVSDYESGRRRIKAETFAELAAFYGVPLRTLLPDNDMPLAS